MFLRSEHVKLPSYKSFLWPGEGGAVRITIELREPALVLAVEGASPERRLLDDTDRQRFAGWVSQYEMLCDREGVEGRLLELGRELYTWLDGSDRWLARL